jgi:hypothetical protein
MARARAPDTLTAFFAASCWRNWTASGRIGPAPQAPIIQAPLPTSRAAGRALPRSGPGGSRLPAEAPVAGISIFHSQTYAFIILIFWCVLPFIRKIS